MQRFVIACVAIVFCGLLATTPASAEPASATVPGYHGGADRSGRFVVPGLTADTARGLRRDPAFDGAIADIVHAQPLYWRPEGAARGLVVVATASNTVVALDGVTGRTVWQRSLGRAATRAEVACGNINPIGITGTPVIDPKAGKLYLDAMVDRDGAAQHVVYGLALRDGAILPGWPVSVADGLAGRGEHFDSRVQEQRGALTLLDGRLYVPFGGYYGDCGAYRGRVVALDPAHPKIAAAWATRAEKGGIWAPGGLVSDGTSLYFATGNTEGAEVWGDGEAIFRLGPDLAPATDRGFFAPANWRELDETDADLGGTSPTLVDLAGARLVLGLGKDGRAYLLDRDRLGGIGEALATYPASRLPIRSATATYPLDGAAIVAVHAGCGLLALRVTAAPSVGQAWCAALAGAGAPIATTSDGAADPLVWVLGAEGDGRLHGFRGDTGAEIFTGEKLPGTRHFETILAADHRLYFAIAGGIVAYAVPPPP